MTPITFLNNIKQVFLNTASAAGRNKKLPIDCTSQNRQITKMEYDKNHFSN